MAIGLYGPLGGLEFAEGLSETTPPFLSGQTPSPGAVGVSIGADVLVTVDDLDAGVLLASVIITMNRGSGFEAVYNTSAFQAGFGGSVGASGFGWAFTINPVADFAFLQFVQVRVQAEDADGNSLDETYSFTTQSMTVGPNAWLSGFSLTPVLPFITPPSDTIRGGSTVIVFAEDPIMDLSRDRDFLGRVVPAGWTPFVTGTGTATAQQGQGILCNSGTGGNAVAGLESTDTYLHGDVAIDFEVLDAHGSVLDAADMAVLEWRSAAGDIARVRIVQGVGLNRAQLVAIGEEVVGGVTTFGGIEAWDAVRGTLRIVRNGSRVFAFVGVRELGTASVYTRLVQVLDVRDFTSGAGTIRFYSASRARRSRVRARFARFTDRPHATISGRLLVDKTEIGMHVFGRVPAATLEELGARPFILFGLFGELNSPTGFTYVLPPPLTVGLDSTKVGITVQDPVLKDGV